MTSIVRFPSNLTEVDPLTRPDHSYLTGDDECFFLREYTARKGFAHSDTNNLVINLKKPMDRKGRTEWRYKGIAIRNAARAFRDAIDDPCFGARRSCLSHRQRRRTILNTTIA